MVGLHSSHVLQIQTKNGKKVSVCSSWTHRRSPEPWKSRSDPPDLVAQKSAVRSDTSPIECSLKRESRVKTFAQLFQTVSETSGSSDSSKIISFLLINSAKLSGSHVGYSSSSKLPKVEWRQWQSASHSVIKW